MNELQELEQQIDRLYQLLSMARNRIIAGFSFLDKEFMDVREKLNLLKIHVNNPPQ